MKNLKDYLSRDEALEALGVKTATLYSYVSRGLIRSVPTPGTKKHQYSREDVERFAARGRGRIARSVVAGTSMRWGEPVINSSITYIDEQGPVYRNRSAIQMAKEGHTFETIAHLLITGLWRPTSAAWPVIQIPENVLALIEARARMLANGEIGDLLAMVVLALGMDGRGDRELTDGSTVQVAREVIEVFIGCLGLLTPQKCYVARMAGESIAAYVLRASGVAATPEALTAINAALITLADHELAAATFVARITASVDAGICHCIAAAISAHGGYATGAGTERVETQLLSASGESSLSEKLELVRRHGVGWFGFNHPLYPDADPRADFILSLAWQCQAPQVALNDIVTFLSEAKEQTGSTPGLAIALVALTQTLGMPSASANALWIIARTAGWVAHVSEQRSQAFMLRPRAKFVSSF